MLDYENKMVPLATKALVVSKAEKQAIKNNSNILSVKEEYIVRKNDMNRYMDVLKYLNKGNTGNTCSLCLTNNVTVYFNPCGHTSCEECFKRMNDRIDISQTNIQNF